MKATVSSGKIIGLLNAEASSADERSRELESANKRLEIQLPTAKRDLVTAQRDLGTRLEVEQQKTALDQVRNIEAEHTLIADLAAEKPVCGGGRDLELQYRIVYSVPNTSEAFDHLRLGLRRGSLILAVMAQLRNEQYGYVLCKVLQQFGIDIDENTLYPLLRRLEAQGLLESQWRMEDRRKKRFYRLSKEGVAVLEDLLREWHGINMALERIINHDSAF